LKDKSKDTPDDNKCFDDIFGYLQKPSQSTALASSREEKSPPPEMTAIKVSIISQR